MAENDEVKAIDIKYLFNLYLTLDYYGDELSDHKDKKEKLKKDVEGLLSENELLKNKLREYEKKINILTREKEEAILKLKEEKK